MKHPGLFGGRLLQRSVYRSGLFAGIVFSALAPVVMPGMAMAQTRKAQPTDAQILAKVRAVLKNEPAFAGMTITPTVSHGTVSLDGNVTSEAAKVLASTEIANIAGIKTVLNNLNIGPDAAAMAPAPQPAPVPAPPPQAPVHRESPLMVKNIVLQPGTVIPVRINDEINTKTAKANDTFHGTTASAILQGDYTLIPTGTPVTGRVIEAKSAGHFTGKAELSLELVSVRLPVPSGTHGSNPMGASPESMPGATMPSPAASFANAAPESGGASGTGAQDVSIPTDPLSSAADARGKNTAEKTGGGAALGAVIGALAGGGAGAAIGAVSGGALGAGSNAVTKGKEIDIQPEQLLQFHTAAEVQIPVAMRNGRQVNLPPAQPVLSTRPGVAPAPQ